jgi:hypothetical protein
MGTQGNTTTESPHTRVANLPSVFGKVMGNKRCKLNGDMAFTFKKLIESLEKIETLKLELEREAIETTKSIAQSMIVTKEGFRKENRKQILQLAQILTTKFKIRCPPNVQKN